MRLRIVALGSLIALCGVASVIYASVRDEALEALSSHMLLPKAERTAVYRCDAGKSIEAGFSASDVGLTVSDGRTFLLSQTASALTYANEEKSEIFRMDGVKASLSLSNENFENCILNDALDEQVPKGIQEGQTGMINLVSLGKSISCNVSQKSDTGTATGTVYAFKHSLRADFVSPPSKAGQTHMHIISDGQYAYAWEDGNTLGMKFDLLALAEEQSNARAAGMIPQDAPISWSCEEWELDEKEFDPPSSVYFSETAIPPTGIFWML